MFIYQLSIDIELFTETDKYLQIMATCMNYEIDT